MKKLLLAFILLFSNTSAFAATKIEFWHSMGGQLGTALEDVVQQFNLSQKDYEIVPIYKGTYSDMLTSLVAAFRAHQQPGIAQVFEVGTATMINPPGAIKPVYQLMQETRTPFDTEIFIPVVAAYYSDTEGRLLAMPFNSSSAVMYYNKDAFKKAGLDPDNPPKTWPEVVKASQKLLKAGYSCGFTTGWPSWTQIETFSAWHNQPIATEDNGFKSLNATMTFNNPVVIKQIAALVQWEKQNIFRYGGRGDNAQSLFTSEACGMFIQSSGARANIQSNVRFKLGTALLPYWPNVPGTPQNTIIGGAALWTFVGKSKAEYQGIAKFYQFLTTPAVQVKWQEATGYIPVTQAAYALSKQQGFYVKNPGAEIAIKELNHKPPKPYTKGLRLGYYSNIRDINDEEIEFALSEQKTAKEAMDEAVKRDNLLLRRFEQTVK